MSEIRTVGLDLAKNVFQVHGADGSGAVVSRRQVAKTGSAAVSSLASQSSEGHYRTRQSF